MKLTWYGHSCFLIETGDTSLVLDPYGDGSVPGFGPLRLKADAVLCSHEHTDHSARHCVELSGNPCHVRVEKIATWHDEVQGAKRGPNTVHIVFSEGLKIVHLGDLGCALTEAQITALKAPDALLIPVGGFYTIDTEQALAIAGQLEPRVVIPMHYRDQTHGYSVISTADAFRAACRNPVDYPGNSLELTEETEAQTAFLTL